PDTGVGPDLTLEQFRAALARGQQAYAADPFRRVRVGPQNKGPAGIAGDGRRYGVQSLRQSLGRDGHRAVETVMRVEEDVQVDCSPLADRGPPWPRVLVVDHRNVKVGHGLPDAQDILVAGAASTVAILNQHAVFFLAGRFTIPDGSRR